MTATPRRHDPADDRRCLPHGRPRLRDRDGHYTYIGRADYVFKVADYRISPFELESILIEHPAVAEAAVVPAPDPVRTAIPKACIALAAGWPPDRDTALAIFRHVRDRLRPWPTVSDWRQKPGIDRKRNGSLRSRLRAASGR